MKKTIIYLVVLLSAYLMTSCSEEQPKAVNGVTFELQSFEDFLWKKDPVDTISIVLNAEFKDCEESHGSLVFALCDSDQKEVSDDVVTVYVDGEKTGNNRIHVPVKCGAVDTKIGLVISQSQLLGDITFDWHLKLVDDAGLKKLLFKDENNMVEVIGKDDPWIFGTDIHIKNTHVANTLKVWSITGLWIILAALIAAHILSRVINRPVKFTNVKVGYDDDQMRSYTTRGCYMVVLTNKPYKVSLFHRFFVGKVAVIKDSFWTEEVILKNLFGQNLMLRTKGDYILPDEPLRKEEFIIKNEEGRTATLRTN